MYPHRIRLRGPWRHEPLGPGAPPASRLTLPAAWADSPLGQFRGRARLRRQFGYPGRIDEHERVFLTVEAPGLHSLSLNDTAGPQPTTGHALEWDVTDLLAARNELTLDLEGGPGVALPEVALEVRCLAWLRDVRVACEGDRTVATGQVVGRCDGPLDLYLIVDRSPADQATVQATEAGSAFRLVGGGNASHYTTVELVRGAVVWYTVRHESPLPPSAQGPCA